MTNEANDGVECLTFGDIYALAGPESQGIDSWNAAEALASELGSSTDLPDASLDIVGPGEESGPFASFVDLVIEEFNEDRGDGAPTRPAYPASPDDNRLLHGLTGHATRLGRAGSASPAGAQRQTAA